mgnify:CR=1 FL=1
MAMLQNRPKALHYWKWTNWYGCLEMVHLLTSRIQGMMSGDENLGCIAYRSDAAVEQHKHTRL